MVDWKVVPHTDDPNLPAGMYVNQFGVRMTIGPVKPDGTRQKLYLNRNICPICGTIWICWSVLSPSEPISEGYCSEAHYKEACESMPEIYQSRANSQDSLHPARR
jgi:hypothetical protein